MSYIVDPQHYARFFTICTIFAALPILLRMAADFVGITARRDSAAKATLHVFEENEEMTFEEIAKKWEQCANTEPGFSYDDNLLTLLKAFWQDIFGPNLRVAYDRVRVQEHLRDQDYASGGWSREKASEVLPHLAANIRLRTALENDDWNDLQKIPLEFYNHPHDIMIYSYLKPTCIPQDRFYRWLKNSKIRLPKVWTHES